jgi:hypothetical protein
MGNGALAYGPKLPRPSSTLPNLPFKTDAGVVGFLRRSRPAQKAKTARPCAGFDHPDRIAAEVRSAAELLQTLRLRALARPWAMAGSRVTRTQLPWLINL